MSVAGVPTTVDGPKRSGQLELDRIPLTGRGGLLTRVWRGRREDPAWIRPALLALLTGTAVLYLWGLSASGWANAYYTAAVQAGTKSWKAFLFGSTDSANFITIDKTPASLWPAIISARIFGLNSWSVLAPQAIEGVAAVGVLYLTLRRWFGAPAGLLAGLVLATTPAATLMFRFNNPDALLVLCLVVGAYGVTRAIEDGRTRWVVLAGMGIGFGFLAKELQAFLVVPAFTLAFFLAAPGTWLRRLRQLVVMGIATIVAAGWFVAILVLTPASSRPYIGGSQNNSFWNVLFGYNGLGRITGDETGSVGGGPAGGTGRWGPTGWTRMFNNSFGGGASWLLPAALFLVVVGVVVTARRARTDRTRAGLILWGGWLLVTGVAFSLSKGIIHEYYTVALAPAVGAVVAIGAVTLWMRRDRIWARASLAISLGLSAWWAGRLFDRSPAWHPRLGDAVTVGAIVVAIAVGFGVKRRGIASAVALGGVVVCLAGPGAASVTTANTAHNGPLPSAGPAVAGAGFGRGGFGGGRFGGGRFGGGQFGGGQFGGGQFGGGQFPSFGGGQMPNFGGGNLPGSFPGGIPGGTPGGGSFFGRGQRPSFGGGGGGGGPFASPEPARAVTKILRDGRTGGYRWSAAAIGATNAAGYQIASGEPIMAIGGFNGSDPTPTLAEFQKLVGDGRVHYFISGPSGIPGGGGGGGPSGSAGDDQSIAAWAEASFESRTVAGLTLYDFSRPKEPSGGAAAAPEAASTA